MKFIVTKNRDGVYASRKISDSATPTLVGNVRLFIGVAAPTEGQMAALFAPTAEPRELSKLTIMERFVALGKWSEFKAVLAAQPEQVQDAWLLAQSIRTDHPLFTTYAPALKAALGLTDEQFATVTA